MKPGDLIEWVHNGEGPRSVRRAELLWSTVEGRYVHIGSEMIHLLVSINDKMYVWLNEKGTFRAHVSDKQRACDVAGIGTVVPRVCKPT